MEKINELCKNLKLLLNETVEGLEFKEEILTFNLKEFLINPQNSFYTTDKFDSLYKVAGLYLFEIKRTNIDYLNWIQSFEKRFRGREENEKFFLHQFTPNIIEKRKNADCHTNSEWIPLYLGKSKNIKERLLKHLFSPLGKPPFALKLFYRYETDEKLNQVFRDETFRIKIIRINEIAEEHYDLVAPFFEKEIRERIHPIVGRQ